MVVEDDRWNTLDLESLADRAVRATLAHRGLSGGEVVILACDDARIAALNADFRGKPRPTNVLSWPAEELGAETDGAEPLAPESEEFGDIAIAWETCEAEARAADMPTADHVTHLIVHAVLHLLGHDHERDGDAALMEGREVEILAQLGLPDPYTRQAAIGAGTMEGDMSQADSDVGANQDPGDIEDDSSERGFFGRLFTAFSPPDDPDAEEEERHSSRMPPDLLNLSRMRVADVAIPSVEIVSVPIDISWDDLVETFRESGLTRLPVYDGTLDHPKGMIHLKDFALKHGFGKEAEFDISGMLRPVIYAPPSMPIGVLLQRMQSERTHMALVIDEYGGVDGLVTIEDLIEQVIGQIEDEHDEDEDKLYLEEKSGVWLAQARTPLAEFEDATGTSFTDDDEDEEIDTLGGLVVVLTGRVPARGEVVAHPSGAEIEIVDADPRRLKRLRVRLPA